MLSKPFSWPYCFVNVIVFDSVFSRPVMFVFRVCTVADLCCLRIAEDFTHTHSEHSDHVVLYTNGLVSLEGVCLLAGQLLLTNNTFETGIIILFRY